MMDYDQKILEEKFKQLPKEIQAALTSAQVSAELKDIADKHGLLLDQASIMFDITSYVMLGLLPSKDFVRNLSREARIDTDKAQAIAKDINDVVFNDIKASIQSVQEREAAVPTNHKTDLSALERAGGFSVERAASEQNNVVIPIDRNKLLSGIENPVTGRKSAFPQGDDSHTDAIVDHLLAGPTARPEEKAVHEAPAPANLPIVEENESAPPTPISAAPTPEPAIPKAAPAPTKPRGPDMYREMPDKL